MQHKPRIIRKTNPTMTENPLYRIALTMLKGIGPVQGRQLLCALGSAEAVFTEKKRLLETVPGISRAAAIEIARPEALRQAEQELLFVEKNKIALYFITDENYPFRLKECDDAPLLFYFKGTGRPHAPKVLSIVGTRHITDYGKELTRALIGDLSRLFPGLLIVSGLAYGVDIQAHRQALHYGLPTVGVLAHGLDRLYPPAHRSTAVEMLEQGGLLTDFPSGTNPDRPMFVCRNRIVAGLADATVVVESAEKGGSLITADLAFSYNRDVYSFPGRVGDARSSGCNRLIRQNKAGLITCAADLVASLGWETEEKRPPAGRQKTLPLFDLTSGEQQITSLLKEHGALQVNQLARLSELPVWQLAPVLFDLEMKGAVKALPGGRYRAEEQK